MHLGGPVGTTLKLDYWDERWRMGTLFPTTWWERRLAQWARLWRSARCNSSHNFFNNKTLIPWVCIFVQWLQDASEAATHQRWRFLTMVSLTVVATGMGFYWRCKERAWAQHRIIEFSWRCRAKICSLQQTPPTTQAGVQGVRKGLGKTRIGILWWWWGHPTSLTIMSPAEMMYCHHCLCKFLVLRTRFAAKKMLASVHYHKGVSNAVMQAFLCKCCIYEEAESPPWDCWCPILAREEALGNVG
jgi:hypothetical protein